MSNDGRGFEAWVREHELLLQEVHGAQPDQIRTEWRYRVRGKHSGQLREVDVAIFVDAGYRTLFIAIECRDRNGREGLPWIEQLVAKKRDIGADRMVAVTRNGFSRYARQSATANEIEAYTLSERDSFGDGKAIAEMEVSQWRPEARILNFSWKHRTMVIDAFGPIPELSENELAELSQGFEEPRWLDTETKMTVSLKEVLASTLTWGRLLEGVPRDGSHGIQTITSELPENRYVLNRDMPEGTGIVLGMVRGDFEVWFEPHTIPANRITQYRDTDNEPVVELHEYDGRVWGLDGQTVFFAPVARKPIQG